MSERGKMRIRHQIRVHARGRQQLTQNFGMALGRLRNPGGFAPEPGEHLPPCVRDGRGTLEHTRVGGHAQESEEARPGQADGRDAAQPLVEPAARALVLGIESTPA